jgi:hypothetical protein
MAYTKPKVWYSATLDGTYVELTGIQSINITRGRQRFVDPFQGSQCVIELIPANSYSPALAIGQFLDVRPANNASSPCYFNGRITDVERSYGIPYNASATIAAPADRITITVTGGTGVIGSAYSEITSSYASGFDAVGLAGAFVMNAGVFCNYDYVGGPSLTPVYPSGVIAGPVAYSTGDSYFEIVNQLLRTAQWVIDDADIDRTYSIYKYAAYLYPASSTGTTITFSDTAAKRYNQIDYLSSMQQSFSYVAVEPVGLATQYKSSGDLKNGFKFTSYDVSTTQALNLATYVQLVSNQNTPVPFVIRTNTAVDDTVGDLADLMTYPVGTAVNVTFRGSTVQATVQGWQFGFYPDIATVSCYLSASLGTPFTLDSTAFGVLDTNRLGYP